MIPIRNLYYLLCYAWDILPIHSLFRGSVESAHTPAELLSRMFVRSLEILVRQGLKAAFISHSESTQRLRGKILFRESISDSPFPGKLHCQFDRSELNHPLNQALKYSILKLLNTKDISRDTHKSLKRLLINFQSVDAIKIPIHRLEGLKQGFNEGTYLLAIHLMILFELHVIPHTSEGQYLMMDITREESWMGKLFESFVRNFYKIEQTEYKVQSSYIYWKAEANDKKSKEKLPVMRTDMVLSSPVESIIIDTKFYKESFQKYFDHESLISSHLYQIFAYLKNFSSKNNNPVRAILIYPANSNSFSYQYDLQGNKLSIESVNLNSEAVEIHHKLLSLLHRSAK